jgi:hypothetical protein
MAEIGSPPRDSLDPRGCTDNPPCGTAHVRVLTTDTRSTDKLPYPN